MGLDVGTHPLVFADVDHLLVAPDGVPPGREKILVAGRRCLAPGHLGAVFHVQTAVRLGSFVQQGGEQGNAVTPEGSPDAADGGQRRHPVVELGWMVADGTGRNAAGPADDGGNAEPAFPRVLLDAVKRPVIAEELRILAAFVMRAVV